MTRRDELRKAIATDIYRAAQQCPMGLTADGGELASLIAELAIRRIENDDTTEISLAPTRKVRATR